MANRWGNSENSDRLYFGGSKITADGDCSSEIKRHVLLGRKAMSNLDSILKSRDITLPTKVHLVKAMVFPGVMYGCENWTIKKAGCWRIDAFELWYWRRLLRVWGRSNLYILKEISPEYSLEGLMLKLKLQYFGATSCEELTLHTRWPKYWSFSFSISPSSEYSGLISFQMDWFDILAVWGTLKSLLQLHNLKTSVLKHSAFFMVQLSHPYMTAGKTIALTIRTSACKVMSLFFNTEF